MFFWDDNINFCPDVDPDGEPNEEREKLFSLPRVMAGVIFSIILMFLLVLFGPPEGTLKNAFLFIVVPFAVFFSVAALVKKIRTVFKKI